MQLGKTHLTTRSFENGICDLIKLNSTVGLHRRSSLMVSSQLQGDSPVENSAVVLLHNGRTGRLDLIVSQSEQVSHG